MRYLRGVINLHEKVFDDNLIVQYNNEIVKFHRFNFSLKRTIFIYFTI